MEQKQRGRWEGGEIRKKRRKDEEVGLREAMVGFVIR